MKLLYGIEIQNINNVDITPFVHNIFDKDNDLFIYASKDECNIIEQYVIDLGISFELFPLYYLNRPEITNLFYDYGFQSEDQQHYYLYADNVCAFSIIGGKEEQIMMAQYQYNEHIIATNLDVPILYCVDKHQIELMKGIAKAYDIEVSFFDLDKTKKND